MTDTNQSVDFNSKFHVPYWILKWQVFVSFKAEAHPQETRRHSSPGQLVEIPSQFKKLVNGPGGDNLRSVSTITGAEVTRGVAHRFYVSGDKKKAQHAEFLLRRKVVSL